LYIITPSFSSDSGNFWGTYRDEHWGRIQGAFEEHAANNIPGKIFKEYAGNSAKMQGNIIRAHPGNIQGPFWEHSRNIRDPFCSYLDAEGLSGQSERLP
jgi:hypothetical protein